MDFIPQLIIVLVAALVGRFLSKKMKQPVILGELILGAIIGNMGLRLTEDYIVWHVANVGILFLLFFAGLSLNLKEFKKIETSSTLVAILGVILGHLLRPPKDLGFDPLYFWYPGGVGLNIFIFLSGFLLIIGLLRKDAVDHSWIRWYKSRIIKIFPFLFISEVQISIYLICSNVQTLQFCKYKFPQILMMR